MRTKIQIGVAEDHMLYRDSIVDHLNKQSDFQVVLEAENGEDLLHKLKVEQPDIILLDLRMPVLNGQQTLAEIRKIYPSIKTIILSLDNDISRIIDLKIAGAHAYIDKAKSSSENFFQIIRDVYFERHSFSIEYFSNGHAIDNKGNHNNELHFTPKEKKIMPLMAEKRTSDGIASHLNLSSRTVEWHRSNILQKIKCKNIDDFILWYEVNFKSREGN